MIRPGETPVRAPRLRSDLKKLGRSRRLEKLPLFKAPEVPEIENVDEEIESMRQNVTELKAPSAQKKDWLVTAALAAQSRHARSSDTFITESVVPENIELYPNYAREIRRKQVESKKINKPPEHWPPSPIVRVNYNT